MHFRKGLNKECLAACSCSVFLLSQLSQLPESGSRLAEILPTRLQGSRPQLAVTSDLAISAPATTTSVAMETNPARPSSHAGCDVMSVFTWLPSPICEWPPLDCGGGASAWQQEWPLRAWVSWFRPAGVPGSHDPCIETPICVHLCTCVCLPIWFVSSGSG